MNAGVVVQPRVIVQPRVVMQPRVRVVRRPIFVRAPEIRVRYFNYYEPPAVLPESYPAREGYTWVAGQWTWTGYEWTWQAGHYEPIPQPEYYDKQHYDAGYSQSGYYSQTWSSPPCDH